MSEVATRTRARWRTRPHPWMLDSPNWLIVPSTGQIRSAAASGRAPSFSARVKKSLKLVRYAATSLTCASRFMVDARLLCGRPQRTSRRRRAALARSDVAGERGQAALRQHVLGQDLAAMGHGGRRLPKRRGCSTQRMRRACSGTATLAASVAPIDAAPSDLHPWLDDHLERHRTARIGWLRASVLGADDGIVSTASLVVGVAAAHATQGGTSCFTGVAGLVAGARCRWPPANTLPVHSQADTEAADLAKERAELAHDPGGRAPRARRDLRRAPPGRGPGRPGRRPADGARRARRARCATNWA